MKRCHPGGGALTRRLLSLAGWDKETAVLDVGCGDGETAALLQALCSPESRGVDLAPAPGAESYIVRGDACRLPFESGSFGGVLFECSLSLVEDPEAALREAYRVLQAGGRLAVANAVARGEGCGGVPCLGRLEAWEAQRDRIEAAGFALIHEEDRTEELLSLFGTLLLSGDMPPDTGTLRRARPGYRISVWQKCV